MTGAAVVVAVLACSSSCGSSGCATSSRTCTIVADLQESDELSFLGDTGAADNVQEGAKNVSEWVPDAISAVLGWRAPASRSSSPRSRSSSRASSCRQDIGNLKSSWRACSPPGEAERWLACGSA